MRHGMLSAGVLTASLLVACATGSREVRDEGSERIEAAMRPEAHPELIPEGIVLGEDAPPLAPVEPEVAGFPERVTAYGGPEPLGWAYGVPVIGSGPACGPPPPAVRYHIEARPGGTIPGLLP
ncbi:hypothetical protein [Hyalangium gracile]|uniref:hypothetical protein n=1 Tax=Hyalangium gracile TaxID=394092 RepID=UPI001CC8F84B|nr:hypothetical protein [Hyalangium gracile]